MSQELTAIEVAILDTLKESNSVDLASSISPDTLLKKCAARGFTDSRAVEHSTVTLIDRDLIEYEMNENLETSNLWLMEA